MRRLALVFAAFAACNGDDGDSGDTGTGPAIEAVFALPADTPDYFATPFPNNLRVKSDGTLDFTGYDRSLPIQGQTLDLVTAGFAGFGPNSAVIVRFAGTIDAEALPDPAETLQDDSPVYLVDVDPDSADRGARVPLRFSFTPEATRGVGPNALRCLPYQGFPLTQGTTWALVVTDRLGNVVASDAFAAVMGDGDADTDVLAARTVYQPLRDWLDEPGGDERADVVDAAVFTTADVTSGMLGLRQAVYALAAPVASNVTQTGTGTGYTQFEGTYDAPNFQSGTVPYTTDGEILFDADGMAVVQHTETLRFAVTVPDGTVPTSGWPIVLYAHGTGGSYTTFVDDGVAETLAAQGMAVVGIDQVLHGPRNPGGNPNIQFLPFNNLIPWRDNLRQSAADDFSLLRLVVGLTIDGDDARVHAFDPDRVAFMGHSLGGLTGPPFLAVEPLVGAAVLSAPPGLIVLGSLYRIDPVDLRAQWELLLGEDVDEFHDWFGLQQLYVDPGDPVNFGPFLQARPIDEVGAKDVLLIEGTLDTAVPTWAVEAQATATSLPPAAPVVTEVDGLDLRGLSPVDLPASANGPNGTTAVLAQYAFGHFAAFHVPDATAAYAGFLGSWARDGRATVP